MTTKSKPYRQPTSQIAIRARRGGSILLLAVAAFAAVAIVGGLSINIAYMEVLQAEQRLATDAAAKAASITLGQTQSVAAARAKAKEIGALHTVGGQPMQLQDANIVFGRSSRGAQGKFQFTAYSDNTSSLNSAKVTSNLAHMGNGGAPLLLMEGFFGTNSFNPIRESIATKIDIDVALVLDRSGSMAWDLSNVAFQYPGQLGRSAMNQRYAEPPHATQSRWSALTTAVGVFTNILDNSPYEPRVAMATYSSNFNFGVWSSTVATLDVSLTGDFASIGTAMNVYGSKPLIGNTNIAAGLREGINALSDPNTARITSTKILVLLSDGIMTQGDNPVELANVARSLNIKIYTIAFSEQADQQLMRNIASAGAGAFYYAPDAATLNSVFREIAETLPAMLTR